MWVVREFVRLLVRIAAAVAIATVIAEVKSLVSGGDFAHTWKITMLLLGALMVILAGAGSRTSGSARRVNYFDHAFGHVEGPQLTATAVFFASGLATIALALVV
jgi:hypothetical protein